MIDKFKNLILGVSSVFLFLIISGIQVCSAHDGVGVKGIIGEDNRQIVVELGYPWSAVAKINIASAKGTSHCTGTLIAPDIVITAAHCLLISGSGLIGSVHDVHVLLGAQNGHFLTHGRVKCFKFHDKFNELMARNGAPPTYDVAVIVLSEPTDIFPVRVTRAPSTILGHRLLHAGYSEDQEHVLTTDATCYLLEEINGLWLTDCDTNFGASGGPVFLQVDGKLWMGAIMVGYNEQIEKRSGAVPASSWIHLAEHADCK